MTRLRSSRLAVLLLLAPLAGCMTWVPAASPAESLLQQPEPPERVRVVTREGNELILVAPVIRAGALVATDAPGAVLLRDVTDIQVEKLSISRTVGLILPGVVILAVVGKQACRC